MSRPGAEGRAGRTNGESEEEMEPGWEGGAPGGLR